MYRENVERLIEEKKKGEKMTTVRPPQKAPVIDLMEALKKSLAAKSVPGGWKPAAPTGTGPKKPTRKRKAA